MHPTTANVHTATRLRWKQHVFVSDSISLIRCLAPCTCTITHKPLQVQYIYVSDCIGGCQNTRMHLQKAGASAVMHTECVCLSISQLPDNVCGCVCVLVRHLSVCIWNWDDRRCVMWERDRNWCDLNPSSIESSSQFRDSCNACPRSISSIIGVATELFHRIYAPNSRHFFSSSLLVLIRFIHVHMLRVFFRGTIAKHHASDTSELKYLTNEWCGAAAALAAIVRWCWFLSEMNFHLVFVCWVFVLFCLSTGFICSFASHTKTHFSVFPLLGVCVCVCVSPLWPFRISSTHECRDGSCLVHWCKLACDSSSVFRSLVLFHSALYLSVLIRIQFSMWVRCACVQYVQNI